MISFLCEKLNNSKLFKFYIVTPLIYAIGSCCENIDVANRIASSKNKKLIVIKLFIFQKFLRYHVCNNDLFDHLSFGPENFKEKILKFILTFLINFEFFFIRTFVLLNDKTFKKKVADYVRFPKIGIKNIVYNDKYLFDKDFDDINPYPPSSSITINKVKLIKDNKFFEKTFQLSNKKIVCLHVRDAKYRSDAGRRGYRNAEINTYIPTIEYLIKKNYIVIRLGDNKKNKINYSNPNFIDLEVHDYDISIIHNCSFFIGTLSGPLDTSYMFQKPTLLTNATSVFVGYPRSFRDRVIFKKAILNDKKISLYEFLNLPFKYHNYLENNHDLKLIDNSPDEILEATKEFLYNLEKNNFEKTFVQHKFNEDLIKQMKIYFNDKSNDNSLHQHYLAINFIRWTKTQQGAVCDFLLSKESKEN